MRLICERCWRVDDTECAFKPCPMVPEQSDGMALGLGRITLIVTTLAVLLILAGLLVHL